MSTTSPRQRYPPAARVNEGMRRQLDHERRLGAMDDYLAWYEAERIMEERTIHVRSDGHSMPH